MNKITVGIAGALAFVIANLAAAAGEEGNEPLTKSYPTRVFPMSEVGRDKTVEGLPRTRNLKRSTNQGFNDLRKFSALRIEPRIYPVFRLGSIEASVRQNAVVMLGKIAGANPAHAPWVVNHILPLLQDKDGHVRFNATEAVKKIVVMLGKIVDKNHDLATAGLRDDLVLRLRDQAADVRIEAAWALGKIVIANRDLATAELRDDLVLRLRDQAADVRRNAAWALGYVVEAKHDLATAGLRNALTPLLQDQYVGVRRNAAYALERVVNAHPEFATAGLRDDLTPLLQRDQDADVRREADGALRVIRAKRPDLFPENISSTIDRLIRDIETD
ncbi:MAG: HEAT repeat domain-containing protein [Holosporales bacterium]|jgi:vesicle coat complex subunit|nr:HEAT repeat domain-containing protein [Holosporales bacterium]